MLLSEVMTNVFCIIQSNIQRKKLSTDAEFHNYIQERNELYKSEIQQILKDIETVRTEYEEIKNFESNRSQHWMTPRRRR